MLWTAFAPPACLVWVLGFWANSLTFIERVVGGIGFRVIGWGNVPQGPCIIASKHQSAWETFKLQFFFGNPVIVMKKELFDVPVWGHYMKATGMIPIDRNRGNLSVSLMLQAAQRAVDAGRKIVIYPEATRTAVGAKRPYKSGIAVLYQALNIPVIPVALNSGMLWPRNSFLKKPGTITVEFMPSIQPGLSREELMRTLYDQIEGTTDRLVAEGTDMPPDNFKKPVWN